MVEAALALSAFLSVDVVVVVLVLRGGGDRHRCLEPLGRESYKDRRPDDKSFMVLGPHVDGARRKKIE